MIDIRLRDDTNLDRIDMRDIMYDGVEAVCAHLVDWMGNYGHVLPAAPSPNYRRTGNLGRLWTFSVTGTSNGVTGALGNAVRSPKTGVAYGPFVMSPEDQAQAHKDRGALTTDDVIERQEATARRLFESVVSRRIN